MHPLSPRVFLAALAAAALPSLPCALRAQVGADVSVSYNNAGSSGLSGMDAIVAPIALYPDPLLGVVLPAATSPNDVQAAAQEGGQIDANWQPAVQDLAHYPDVVQWMAGNMDWTNQLGAAFANSPSDVMNAIQDLRQRALADGSLQSNAQQVVVNNGGEIQILPRSMEALYVPQYDPNAVFFGRGGVEISFGAALPCGDWLTFYPAWGAHAIWTGDFFAYGRDHGGWATAFRGGYRSFSRASGFHGNEWHVARDAQIRNVHVDMSHPAMARPAGYASRAPAQSQAYQAPRASRSNNWNNGNSAAQQRYAQSQNRNVQTENRYAQSEPHYAQSPTPVRPAPTAPSQPHFTPSTQQSYAQSNAQRSERPSETRPAASSERPSTFAGDSARAPRASGYTNAKPSSSTHAATQKPASKPAESDHKSDKNQQQ